MNQIFGYCPARCQLCGKNYNLYKPADHECENIHFDEYKHFAETTDNALLSISEPKQERPFNMNFLKPDKLSLWQRFRLLFCKAHYGFDTSMKHDYVTRVTLKYLGGVWYVTNLEKIPKPNVNNPSPSQ